MDYSQNRIDIVYNIVIPESQDSIPLGFKKSGSFRVVCLLFQMLAAIQLNDQFLARGAKIDHIIPYRMLVAEMDIAHSMCS